MTMSLLPALWLDHISIPTQDPDVLAQWYADRLNLEVRGNRLVGPGISIFFTKGAPLRAGDTFHFGFRVESRAAVEAWATHLGVPVAFQGEDYFAARIKDPDGNIFEIYCDRL